jgi:glycosyltransferase involved in cell wall biosynthesis
VTPGEPHVSVVILCHNYGRFLAEAIESALGQTHIPLEVIVIDDGSTDESYEVAMRYAPAVAVLRQPNLGLVEAHNRGLREATAEYVTRLDADDAFQPTYVETLLAALHAEPRAAYAYSAMEYFGAKSGVFRARPFSSALLLAGNYVNSSAVVRRADALAVGGFHATEEGAFEDWDFCLRLLELGKYGVAVEEPLLRYRQHEGPSRNPRRFKKVRRTSRVVSSAHPDLYSRKPPILREALLLSALVAGRLGCRRCLRLLDRAWGFRPLR